MQTEKKQPFYKRIMAQQEMGIFLILIVAIGIFYAIKPMFLSGENVYSMLKTLSFYGIVAVGETLILIGGDTDLSVGSTAGLGAVLGTKLMMDWNCFGLMETQLEWLGVIAIMLLTMVICSVVGIVNALLVVKVKIPPFVATIATLNVGRGLVLIITNGITVYPLPDFFMNKLGQFQLYLSPKGGISVQTFIFIILVIVFEILLRRSSYGRNLYATGSNREVAKLSGINTDKIRFTNFIITAMLAALAGMLVAAFTKQGYPPIGQGWEMEIIAATVVGGISLNGGSGSMVGMLCGVILINVLVTGLQMVGLNTFLQTSAKGVLILAAVYIDRMKLNKKIKA